MTIELSNWFYEGVMMAGGVLSIDRAYFDITGGRERWLYKVARKHAGGGEEGFAIPLTTLFEKSGAEGQYRRFKFEIARIVERDALPGYTLAIEQPDDKREPCLRMRRRAGGEGLPAVEPPALVQAGVEQPDVEPPGVPVAVAALVRRSVTGLATRATAGEITDATLATLRAEYPGWDYQTLHAEFRAWVTADATRTPVNYQNAFIGYVRRFDARNRHTLTG